MKAFKYLLIPVFLICVQNIHPLDIKITDKSAEGYLRGEFNRTSNFLYEFSAIGKIELQDKYLFRGGLSIGRTLIDTDFNIFTGATYSPFAKIPLSVSLVYLYNGLPEYKSHTNSLFPFISYNAERAGISLGVNFRFSRYFHEKAQFESIISMRAYVNILNNEMIKLGLSAGTFDDFHLRNFGAYSLVVYSNIKLNDNWVLLNDIEFLQSGGDGLTTTSYGISLRTGVQFKW